MISFSSINLIQSNYRNVWCVKYMDVLKMNRDFVDKFIDRICRIYIEKSAIEIVKIIS